jgi:hypothetical protein
MLLDMMNVFETALFTGFQINSMGLSLGEYGGKYNNRIPSPVAVSRTIFALWLLKLSRTTSIFLVGFFDRISWKNSQKLAALLFSLTLM